MRGSILGAAVFAIPSAVTGYGVSHSHTSILGAVLVALAAALVGWLVFAGAIYVVSLILALKSQRDEARQLVADHDKERDQRHQFRDICHTWCRDVQTMLDAQAALEPDPPVTGKGALMMAYRRHTRGLTAEEQQADDQRKAHEQKRDEIRKQTRARFIEEFRPRGEVLYGVLYSYGTIGTKVGEHIQNPTSIGEIEITLTLVRDAANQLCV